MVSPDFLGQDYDAAMKLVNDIIGEANRTSVMEGRVILDVFMNISRPIPAGITYPQS